MTKLLKFFLASLLALGFMASTVYAEEGDAVKGQKYYLKLFKEHTGFNGTKFASLHTQAEWEKLFADDAKGFIEEFSKNYPGLKDLLTGDKFKAMMPHIKAFAIKYASDSGNVPSC